MLSVPRELSVATVFHPEHLQRGNLLLVDHPTVRPLQDGAPTLGWEGDPRLAVYLRGKQRRFEVWRLEGDGQYRRACVAPTGAILTPAAVNRLIRHLMSIDRTRGFDIVAATDAAEAAVEVAADKQLEDRCTNDLADRLSSALRRDGVHRHI